MFLNQIRNFFIKNKIKKKLSNTLPDYKLDTIKKIGVIVDETNFTKREFLIKEMILNGFTQSNLSVLIFKDKIYKNEIFEVPTFSYKDLSWSGTIINSDVNYFIEQKFDLLLNYYDFEKLPLILVSNASKASFKVGFSEIDKRINHFTINTNCNNYKIFIEELVKYLKIFKKI